jgi:WD40 repeat protein
MESSVYSVSSQYSHPLIKGPINAVDVIPQNNKIVIGCTEDSVCFSYDVYNMQEQFIFKSRRPAAFTDISINKLKSDKFAISSVDGIISVYSLEKMNKGPKIFDCKTPVWSVSFCYTAPVIAAALDGRIRIFDLREKNNLTSLKTGFDENVTVVKWCPHSKHMLAAGDAAGRLFLFDERNPEKNFQFDWNRTETLEAVRRPDAHSTRIEAISFSQRGSILLSCEQSGIVREWSADDGTSTLNEYRVQPFERELRKREIANGEKGIFIPDKNKVYDVISEEKMVGHNRNVVGVIEVADGLLSYAEDSVCCFWRPKGFVDVNEDKSEWSE